ncbi:hypothetical protein BDBG_06413 [Blastomyces gilchristii SLH14081]|uniref:Uncharacterized protein n=1 Tax=Blastomyces gilchristii (strain SLH14081) TaxID=559298 RepID=A0A179US40_BLAGS|nr:uncharacterized protein BDBG_06413 [Blastomyces gilchristii SLH14081]OAT10593.1 hypothetical protein BDBG_06413 [Blastomyces gilchristii SLH14081]
MWYRISDKRARSSKEARATNEPACRDETDCQSSTSISLFLGVPWSEYRSFMGEEQAESKMVTHEHRIQSLVTIRERKLLPEDRPDCQEEVNQSGEAHFLVHEDMDASHVSLEDIEDSPSEPRNGFDIAALCKQAGSSYFSQAPE